MIRITTILTILILSALTLKAQTKHSKDSKFMSYKGLVMAGYQGWFRAPGDEANDGWGHYGKGGKFDFENNTVDFWPDVSDYEENIQNQFYISKWKTCRSIQFG